MFSESARRASSVDTSAIADDDGDYKVFRKGCLDYSPIYTKAEGIIRILTIIGFYGCFGFLMIMFGNLLDEYLQVLFWIFYIPGLVLSVFVIVQSLRAVFPKRRFLFVLEPLECKADWHYANGFLNNLPNFGKIDSDRITKSWRGGNRRNGVMEKDVDDQIRESLVNSVKY